MNLFVYGTLQPGQRNWPLIADAISAHTPASVRGFKLWDLPLRGYPAVTLDPADGEVFGYLLSVDPHRQGETLSTLDTLEGYDPAAPQRSLYWRTSAQVYPQALGQAPQQAWLYRYNPVRAAELEQQGVWLESGRWPAHRSDL